MYYKFSKKLKEPEMNKKTKKTTYDPVRELVKLHVDISIKPLNVYDLFRVGGLK